MTPVIRQSVIAHSVTGEFITAQSCFLLEFSPLYHSPHIVIGELVIAESFFIHFSNFRSQIYCFSSFLIYVIQILL